MINSKIEKLIFILVFIVFYTVFSVFITEIKATTAPINTDLTPEEVIIEELSIESNDTYQYEIINNSIIVLVERSLFGKELYVGAKNPYSGFMFDVPKSIFTRNPSYIRLLEVSDEGYIDIEIERKIKDYVIMISFIGDIYDDKSNSVIDQNGRPFKKLKFDADREFWVDVLEDIPEDYQIFAELNGKEILIIDANEILDYFGGQ